MESNSRTIKVLIADDNETFRTTLEQKMKDTNYFKEIQKVDNGEDAIDMIATFKPDVLILDVIMPRLDGIGVLEKINEMHLAKNPQIIMVSNFHDDKIVEETLRKGARYYFVKPISIKMLVKRILQLMNFYHEKVDNYLPASMPKAEYIKVKEDDTVYNREAIVTNFIHETGIPPHLSGYRYLIDAILVGMEEDDRINSITKSIYPNVAKINRTTPTRVERGIRNAIESCWNRNHTRMVDEIFKNNVENNKKPTNSEFVAMCADKIRIENNQINWREKAKS